MFYVYMPYLSLSMIRYDWIVLFWAEEWIRTWNLFFCYEIKLGDNDIPHIYIYKYIHTYILDILSLAKKGNEAKATGGPVFG